MRVINKYVFINERARNNFTAINSNFFSLAQLCKLLVIKNFESFTTKFLKYTLHILKSQLIEKCVPLIMLGSCIRLFIDNNCYTITNL